MSDYPPYMNAYGAVPRILDRIKSAQTPERFTQDFLSTKLGFSGGSNRAFIPFAKRIGLIQSDGTPSQAYRAFRNPAESGMAMANMIRHGYSELYARNEFAHDLARDQLEGLLIEITGLEHGNPTLRAIASCFEALKGFAQFDGEQASTDANAESQDAQVPTLPTQTSIAHRSGLGLNLAYTFNLVLPKTSDVAVFNAIFKSLRDNLLDK